VFAKGKTVPIHWIQCKAKKCKLLVDPSIIAAIFLNYSRPSPKIKKLHGRILIMSHQVNQTSHQFVFTGRDPDWQILLRDMLEITF
jgi:hypothetical protein